jgi:hypothetical protein
VHWETIENGTNFHRPWLLGPGQTSSNWIISPSQALAFWDEPTVVRLIFSEWLLSVMPNWELGDLDAHFWSGIIITRGEGQFGTETLPNLDPTNGSNDWLFWKSWHFSSLFTALGTPVRLGKLNFSDEWGNQGGQFDIRSKRRMPQGHGLAFYNFAVEDPDGIGASILGYTSGRVLLLNH